ncbi:MAG: ABC transporter transmembrane domain-containing protein [Pseudomonadota bacterium]|nr:ABC transporter transmembrane domain-containing protein [Pseudomonadota bacterium]
MLYLRGLYSFVQPYRLEVFFAISVLILTALLSLILPLAVRGIVDSFSSESILVIDKYFITAIVIAAFLALGTALRFYLVTSLGERIVADIRMTVFNRVIGMSPQFFEKIMTGEVLSRLTTDTTLILSVVSSSISFAMRNILILFGGLIFMFFTSAKLTGLALLIVPAILLPILFLGRRLRKLSLFSQDKIADTSGMASEALLAFQTVQANNHEQNSMSLFGQMIEESYAVAKKRIFIRSILTAVLIFFVFTGIVTVLWFGAVSVRQGSMSEGELVQFVIYAVLVAGSVAALSETFGELQRAAGASERLAELLRLRDPIAEHTRPKNVKLPTLGHLNFKNVNFSYPTRKEEPALRLFNLQIKPGETVAVVGPSGAGKTTIFQLIMRFYEISDGSILLDGVDIAKVSKNKLRESFALVPQEPVIFGMTAMENIRFGRPTAGDDQVIEAARAADAHEFISELPNQYQTFVGERGVMLSGGQRQRIAIARAILRDAPILLFDEATSSLDSVSERSVQKAVEKLSEGRTTIVIAHRLATVKKANKIVVLNSGSIDAIGSHEELMRADGLYRRLAEMQFSDD